MLDEIFSNAGSSKDIAEGSLTFQFIWRTDAGKHRGSHVAEKKNNILLFGGKHFCDFHRRHRLATAGTAPNRQHAAAVVLYFWLFQSLGAASKDTGFLEIHSITSLSGLAATESAFSLSEEDSSGSAYSSSMSSSCVSINCFAPSTVPR